MSLETEIKRPKVNTLINYTGKTIMIAGVAGFIFSEGDMILYASYEQPRIDKLIDSQYPPIDKNLLQEANSRRDGLIRQIDQAVRGGQATIQLQDLEEMGKAYAIIDQDQLRKSTQQEIFQQEQTGNRIVRDSFMALGSVIPAGLGLGFLFFSVLQRRNLI